MKNPYGGTTPAQDGKIESCVAGLMESLASKYPDLKERKSHAIAICKSSITNPPEIDPAKKYSVVIRGGSIGEIDARRKKGPGGDIWAQFGDLEQAKEYKRTVNKRFSPGERKHYGLHMSVVETAKHLAKTNPPCPNCKNIILEDIRSNPPGAMKCPGCEKAYLQNPEFCESCGADTYLCQVCGKSKCSVEEKPVFLPAFTDELAKVAKGKEGNVCPKCLTGNPKIPYGDEADLAMHQEKVAESQQVETMRLEQIQEKISLLRDAASGKSDAPIDKLIADIDEMISTTTPSEQLSEITESFKLLKREIPKQNFPSMAIKSNPDEEE